MPKSRRAGLTDKQRRFVDEYLIDKNATAAAKRAGYSKRTAGKIGSENLAKPEIARAISRGLKDLAIRNGITADIVLQELAKIALADMTDFYVWDDASGGFIPSSDLTPNQTAAIQSVEAETTTDADGNRKVKLKLKLHDKKGALQEIGKHLGIAELVKFNAHVSGELEHKFPDAIKVELVPAPQEGDGGGPE